MRTNKDCACCLEISIASERDTSIEPRFIVFSTHCQIDEYQTRMMSKLLQRADGDGDGRVNFEDFRVQFDERQCKLEHDKKCDRRMIPCSLSRLNT